MEYQTIYDVKLANRQAGFHFFEAGALRFFRSRIGTELYGGRYFITSERFIGSDGWSPGRRYTIREVKPNGNVDTVGKFQAYASANGARAAIRRLLAQ